MIFPSGFYVSSGGGVTFTYRGAGYERVGSGAAFVADYTTAYEGSAPSAGDLVIWVISGTTSSATTYASPSGWTRSVTSASALFSKVVTSGDLSSPPTFNSSTASITLGSWIAYAVTGISATSHGTFSAEEASAPAPANQTISASAVSAPLIALSQGLATLGATMSWSGATADKNLSAANLDGATQDIQVLFKLYESGTGDSITVSKGDDGFANSLSSAYITFS